MCHRPNSQWSKAPSVDKPSLPPPSFPSLLHMLLGVMMLPLSACLMSWLIFRSCAAQISDMSVINCIIHDKNKKTSEYWYFPAFEFSKYWIIVRRWYLFTRWLNVKLVTKCEYRILLDFSCSVLVIFGMTHAYASYRTLQHYFKVSK